MEGSSLHSSREDFQLDSGCLAAFPAMFRTEGLQGSMGRLPEEGCDSSGASEGCWGRGFFSGSRGFEVSLVDGPKPLNPKRRDPDPEPQVFWEL